MENIGKTIMLTHQEVQKFFDDMFEGYRAEWKSEKSQEIKDKMIATLEIEREFLNRYF